MASSFSIVAPDLWYYPYLRKFALLMVIEFLLLAFSVYRLSHVPLLFKNECLWCGYCYAQPLVWPGDLQFPFCVAYTTPNILLLSEKRKITDLIELVYLKIIAKKSSALFFSFREILVRLYSQKFN